MPCATPPMVGTSRAPSRRSQARRSLVEPSPGPLGLGERGAVVVPNGGSRTLPSAPVACMGTQPWPRCHAPNPCPWGFAVTRGEAWAVGTELGVSVVLGAVPSRTEPAQPRCTCLLLPEAQAAPHCIQGILSPQPCARCPQALGTEQPVMPAMLTCLPCARGRGDRSAAHQRQERVCPHQ